MFSMCFCLFYSVFKFLHEDPRLSNSCAAGCAELAFRRACFFSDAVARKSRTSAFEKYLFARGMAYASIERHKNIRETCQVCSHAIYVATLVANSSPPLHELSCHRRFQFWLLPPLLYLLASCRCWHCHAGFSCL